MKAATNIICGWGPLATWFRGISHMVAEIKSGRMKTRDSAMRAYSAMGEIRQIERRRDHSGVGSLYRVI